MTQRRRHQGHGVGDRESGHHDQQVLDAGQPPEGGDEADQEEQVIPTREDVLDSRPPEGEKSLEGRRVENHPTLPDADVEEMALPVFRILGAPLVDEIERHPVAKPGATVHSMDALPSVGTG